MNNDIKAAAEQVLAGSDETSIAACLDWYRERATLMAAFILSHPYGVLKPLVWANDPRSLAAVAMTPRGEYCIPKHGTCWRLEDGTDEVFDCDSIDHGKQLCEQHYAAEMAKAFTTIGSTPEWIAMSDRHPTDADRANGWVWAWVPGFGLDQMGGIVTAATHWVPGTLPEPTCGPAGESP